MGERHARLQVSAAGVGTAVGQQTQRCLYPGWIGRGVGPAMENSEDPAHGR
jgi:hypothetical protein